MIDNLRKSLSIPKNAKPTSHNIKDILTFLIVLNNFNNVSKMFFKSHTKGHLTRSKSLIINFLITRRHTSDKIHSQKVKKITRKGTPF